MKTNQWAKGDNVKGPCSLCGGQLVVRRNTKTKNLFVGCRSFPSCRMNRPLRVGDTRDTSDSSPTIEAGEPTGTLCAVCEEPQFRSPSGVTCSNGHGGVAGVDPDTREVVYADDAPTPEEPVQEVSDHNKVGFPLTIDSFGMVAVVQSFVYKAWFRRREYVGDVLDPTSCDNFRDEMMRWLNFHKDRGDVHDFQLSYDESVWPIDEGMLHSNRLLLRVKVMKRSVGHYVFDVRLNRPLFECVSSANPTSDHFSVPYNIFDVTFDADHEGTPEHVREALR